MKKRNVPNFWLAVSSASLLLLAFPSFNLWWCAWGALVPWLLLLSRCTPRRAFGWSWLIGLLFFLGSIWWLTQLAPFAGVMAWVGWLLLCASLALYFGVFGLLVSRTNSQLLFIPALWVSLEFLRTHLFSGLGWNLLAYSQTPWLAAIQVADITGVWGVSFIVVLVNIVIADLLRNVWDKGQGTPRLRSGQARDKRTAIQMMVRPAVVLVTILLVVGYGVWRIPQVTAGPVARVAVVQGNIPQEEKWDERYLEQILQRYETLTQAVARETPELIVWPETSAPGFVGLEVPLTQRLVDLAQRVGMPLLVGAPMGRVVAAQMRATNSAILIEADGSMAQRYDKTHLVPFGEFIPFERTAPWLRRILPPIGDFIAGHEHTVFTLHTSADTEGQGAGDGGRGDSYHPSPLAPRPSPRFSALICFEDLFPDLARRFVRNGAQLLLVITNDAWFGPTAAAYQHAQASTFRAVELRVPVARAANTGWSGCIDAAGRWVGHVADSAGRELFVEGHHTCELPLGVSTTGYLRWGDWFAWGCLLISVVGIGYNQGFRG
jgi:apolipoprotein N-acyltransferase